jgi:putative mycofactocin binding protein MftB
MSAPATMPDSGGRGDTAAGAPAQTHTSGAVDLGAAWVLNPKVALRPEPFGALLYHFGTRKLSFLKNLTVVAIVQSLAEQPSAEAALAEHRITHAERPLYLQALGALADSGMITRR